MTGTPATDAAALADPEAPDACPPPAREGMARRWPGRLLLAVAVLWALFVAARALLSGRWWVWNGLGLAPPVLHLLFPLALLVPAALIRHGRRAAVGAVLASLLLGSWQTGLHPGALLRGQPAVPPDALKVVSWNTFFWDQDSDTDAFYAYLKSHSADVYLLQEYQHARGDEPAPIDDLARLRREFPGFHIATEGSSSPCPASRSPPCGHCAPPAWPRPTPPGPTTGTSASCAPTSTWTARPSPSTTRTCPTC